MVQLYHNRNVNKNSLLFKVDYTSQFWNEYNKPWLDNAIEKKDIFKIATEPTWDNLTRVNMFTGKTELTGFGREYAYLKKYGYYFDTVTKNG